jgi:hypothetical protein
VSNRIERVLRALGEANVEYLVVGGVAVVLHGHLRTTADLDLVIRLERDNVRRAMEQLTRLGLRPRAPVPVESFADPEQRDSWVETKGMQVFSLWDPQDSTFDVDIFVREPFDFEAAYHRRVSVPLGATTASVVSLDDLLALKRESGRSQDLADIEALEALSEANE